MTSISLWSVLQCIQDIIALHLWPPKHACIIGYIFSGRQEWFIHTGRILVVERRWWVNTLAPGHAA